jgi:hypothetical protein
MNYRTHITNYNYQYQHAIEFEYLKTVELVYSVQKIKRKLS